MSIPDYQSIMLPFLALLADGQSHKLAEIRGSLIKQFKLTDAELAEILPSGNQGIFENRVGWARTYLKKAGLLESPQRGLFRITPRGQDMLASQPTRIDAKTLRQFPEFLEFVGANQTKDDTPQPAEMPDLETPEEVLEAAHQKLRGALANELLDTIKKSSPRFFERLVIDLLLTMGYGGSRKEAGEAIGKSGDEGIDGIIKEDKLGLDIIYIQAKCWEGTVGRPEIQKFAGALQGQRARKGIFITTSSFSREARDYATAIDSKIILIDGERLAALMIDNNVGVAPLVAYEIKRIDTDYFWEE